MNDQEKIDQIADILDVESWSLTPDTHLDEIGWDSMGMLGVIAFAKQNGIAISGEQIRSFTTVGDILAAAF